MLTHEDVLDWATAMVPRLAERAEAAEAERRLPEATIAECDDIGIWNLVVPQSRGGHGLGLRTLAEMSRTLAHGCMSTAWTTSFLVLHNWFVLKAPGPVQDAVFAGKPYVRMATPLAPGGEAQRVEGGYHLTGRWQWATGIVHSDWVAVMAFVAGPPRPTPRVFMLPVGDVEVVDVWHTSGMRATGSHDVAAHDVFVPDLHTMEVDHLRGDDPPGWALHGDPFLRYPMSSVLVLYAASSAVGGAEAAVDHVRALMAGRVLPHTVGERQAAQATSQARLGAAMATVRASRAVWWAAIEELCEIYDSGGGVPRAERARFRLAAAHAVKLAREAVEIAGLGAGASSYFTSAAFQRFERDLAMLKGHVVYDWDRVTQLAGRLELGESPAPTDLL